MSLSGCYRSLSKNLNLAAMFLDEPSQPETASSENPRVLKTAWSINWLEQ